MNALPITAVIPNPDQPRKRFEAAALDELASSIRTHGLLEPIIVRPVGESFVIIAGERRWRAAAAAGLDTIPAVVRDDLTDAEAFEVSMIENVVRSDMNPIEEAAGYQTLIDIHGLDVDTIASRIGKGAQQIRGRLRLLRLDPPIQKLVADGQMDAYDAGHVAKLSVEGQHRIIRAMNAGQIRYQGDLVRLATAIGLEESQSSMFGDEAPAVPAIDQKATRDLRSALAEALAALDKVERSLDSAGIAAETEEIALMGEQMKRRAASLASRVHAHRAAANARQLALA